VSLGSAPRTGAWRASRVMSFMLVAPSMIAMETSAAPRVHQRELPGPRQRRSQRGGQPGLVGQLAQQHRPSMPDQPVGLSGDPQPVIPRRILHREVRSCYWQLQVCGYLVISQNRGALRYRRSSLSVPARPPAGPAAEARPATTITAPIG
jgi:hypothetical protein